jgi:hypothetical protein
MNRKRIAATGLVLAFLVMFGAEGQEGSGEGTAKAPVTITIDQVISSQYPAVRAYAIITNAQGELVGNLAPNLFTFKIDAMDIRVQSTVMPFQLRKQPIDYTILFSNNGIMDGEPLDFQKNGILQCIEELEEQDTLSVYAVGEEAVPVFEGLRKEAIDVASISKIAVSSTQSRLYDSMMNVLRRAQRRDLVRKVVIVISDGRDQNSRFTKEQLQSVFTETGIPVYALGIRVISAQSLSNLDDFAQMTGGTYWYASRLADIPTRLKGLVHIITNPYVIDLQVRDVKADDLTHKLEVGLSSSEYTGKGDKAFVAVKIPIPWWVKWAVAGAVVLVLMVVVVLFLVRRQANRKRMGITQRRCPDCHQRLKDTWDSCPFCKYLPQVKKKRKPKKQDKGKDRTKHA